MEAHELALFNAQYAAFNEQHSIAHADGIDVEPQLLFFADGTPFSTAAVAPKLCYTNPQNGQPYRGKRNLKTITIKIRNTHKDDRSCLLFGRKGKKGLIAEINTVFAAINDVKDASGVQQTSLEVVHFDEIVASFLEDTQVTKTAFKIVRIVGQNYEAAIVAASQLRDMATDTLEADFFEEVVEDLQQLQNTVANADGRKRRLHRGRKKAFELLNTAKEARNDIENKAAFIAHTFLQDADAAIKMAKGVAVLIFKMMSKALSNPQVKPQKYTYTDPSTGEVKTVNFAAEPYTDALRAEIYSWSSRNMKPFEDLLALGDGEFVAVATDWNKRYKKDSGETLRQAIAGEYLPEDENGKDLNQDLEAKFLRLNII